MSIQFTYGAGSQAASINKPMLPWNFVTAFRVVSDTGSMARMTDILSPLDKKTTLKVSLDRIANVYSTLAQGTIPAASQSANTQGHTVFCELSTIATSTVGDVVTQLPIVSRIELRLPDDANIAESDITSIIMATFAGLCDAAGNPTVVTEKMRGALTPTGI